MSFRLGDDGTLDTIVVCEDCGTELRYSYALSEQCDDNESYDDFIKWAIADAEEEHSCGVDFDRSPSGWEEN